MKIVLISTWPPRHCGIATYSDNLVSGLRKIGQDVEIVCHTDGGRKGETKVHPVIDMSRYDFFAPMEREVEKINPEIIHIQHEFGIWTIRERGKPYVFDPERAFILAIPLFSWRLAGRPTVITYHSVFSKLTYPEALYYDHLMNLATANIVHEPYQKENLPKNLGRKIDNVFVIPHGAFKVEKRYDKEALKKKFGYPGKLTLGMLGWWEYNKGFEQVVKIWPEILRKSKRSDLILVIAGGVRPKSPKGPSYKRLLLKEIEKCPAKKSIRIIEGAFSQEFYNQLMASFEIGLFPYLLASQSGNLAHSYSQGVPVITSALEGLASSVKQSKAGLLYQPGNLKDLLNKILKLIEDEKMRRRFSQNALLYVEKELDWEVVAKKHLKVYEWAIKEMEKRDLSKYLSERLHV